MEFLVAQLLNGLVYGVLLFLMAAGLSLIFGLMNVVSLAHGSFFMLGAFFGLSIFKLTGSFWLALLLAPIPVVVLGIVDGVRVHAAALPARPHGPGAADVRLHLCLLRSGADGLGPACCACRRRRRCRARCRSALGVFSAYRLFLIGFGFAIALLLWLFLERSRARRHGPRRRRRCRHGRGPRRQHPGAVHRHLRRSAWRWRRSAASRPGPCSASTRAWTPKSSFPAFIVIVIGGMGSLRGAFVGSLLIGIADTFGKAYFPSTRAVSDLSGDGVVLLIRPQGLFGIKYSDVADRAGRHRPSARRRRYSTRAAGWSRCSLCWRCRSAVRTTRARWSPRSTSLRSSP